jgi:hypothetical protein
MDPNPQIATFQFSQICNNPAFWALARSTRGKRTNPRKVKPPHRTRRKGRSAEPLPGTGQKRQTPPPHRSGGVARGFTPTPPTHIHPLTTPPNHPPWEEPAQKKPAADPIRSASLSPAATPNPSRAKGPASGEPPTQRASGQQPPQPEQGRRPGERQPPVSEPRPSPASGWCMGLSWVRLARTGATGRRDLPHGNERARGATDEARRAQVSPRHHPPPVQTESAPCRGRFRKTQRSTNRASAGYAGASPAQHP